MQPPAPDPRGAAHGSSPRGRSRPRTRRGWGQRDAGLVGGCVGIGLLLWARLILVSDMPRMALADPEHPINVRVPVHGPVVDDADDADDADHVDEADDIGTDAADAADAADATDATDATDAADAADVTDAVARPGASGAADAPSAARAPDPGDAADTH